MSRISKALTDKTQIDQLTASGYSITKIARPPGYDPDQSDDFLPDAQYVVVLPNGVVRRVLTLDDLDDF